ncbi:hypothetical protein HBH70_058080 [Parastagonospora nodorum]|uniref:Uncharacterized protein n=1 Tax=Phaeosphaeria nodorum (strain SN15 / ATCC MYA-4574 / FGSC 10173) TaxID=321614 RepID=A0A7U2EY97_PHANO|nr:hypothetical protein HBH45_055660 [Parastagonospora nodorum]QRC94128.1 hypothetical protein JI435_405210 [Parastagonospora nodorum SN15]KAH4156196.1 hypothetical protein HBH44_132400 [Parastagonospora nodorum]KAH4507328.1 hypothetical protein HBH89_073120 [Parastagonospora nodorum]KAH4555080.1 hypothetical protein HBH86_104570 [Parastagonospora nodorum]
MSWWWVVTDSHDDEAFMTGSLYGNLVSDSWKVKDARQLHVLSRWFCILGHILTIP